MRKSVRRGAREPSSDEIADARHIVGVDLDVASTGDRKHRAGDRRQIDRGVVRHVLTEPTRRQILLVDPGDVPMPLEQELSKSGLLTAQESSHLEPADPRQRRGDAVGLMTHDRLARVTRTSEEDSPGERRVPARQSDRDRGAAE